MSCYSIFAETVLIESMALVAVFGTNIDISPHESKKQPIIKIFGGKKFKIFQKKKKNSMGQINGSKSCFVLCQLLSGSEKKSDGFM